MACRPPPHTHTTTPFSDLSCPRHLAVYLQKRQRELAEKKAEQADEEARQKREEAATQAELEKAMDLSRQLSRQQSAGQKKESLPEEPAAGPTTTTVQVKLPDGKSLRRRFPQSCTLAVVRDWLFTVFHDRDINITNYSLNSSFPKRTFMDEDADNSLTLVSAGLHPQGSLFLQDLEA